MEKKNSETNDRIINIKIETEKDLYQPFDPEKSLNDDVKTYILNKASEKHREDVHIRIISPALRIQAAILNHLVESVEIEFVSTAD